MQEFSIGDVMRMTGLSRATILYYEQKGLIHPIQHAQSGYRGYSIEDLSLVMLYQNMKQMEISVGDFAGAIGGRGDGEIPDVETLLSRKKQIYLRKISAYLAMVRYWDQALAFLHMQRDGRKPVCTEQFNDAAWVLSFSEKTKETKKAMAHWDEYFLQRNLCYFFRQSNVENGVYTFERGMSCYVDCALELSSELQRGLHYKAPKRCLAFVMPFDFKEENFATVFSLVKERMEEHHVVMDGDPWGNFSIPEEKDGQSNNLFLWVPVQNALPGGGASGDLAGF